MVEPEELEELEKIEETTEEETEETEETDTATAPLSDPTIALTRESLMAAVHASFQRRYQERISLESIGAVIDTLDLRDYLGDSLAPQLQVTRLRFTGVKHLRGHDEPQPMAYDQRFLSGVNVLLIEKNSVGKSSVWKTIKFALTGDERDIDADVWSWIHHV